jgi:hypothetical protein
MNTIVIEANSRNQLIFGLSCLRSKVKFKSLEKIFFVLGEINKKTFYFNDIVKFLNASGIKVALSNRKNFLYDIRKSSVHSMYTFSFVPVALLKYKILNLSSAQIFRYEEGLGSYSNWISTSGALLSLKYYYLALRAPLGFYLCKILNILKVTSNYYLIKKNNTIYNKLKNLIIQNISEINSFNFKKNKYHNQINCKYKALVCINSLEEFYKFQKFGNFIDGALFKMHPRFFKENYDNFKLKKNFYKGNLTAEELVFAYKVPIVISFDSSVSVYCSILYDTICYNIKSSKQVYCKRVESIFKKFTINKYI